MKIFKFVHVGLLIAYTLAYAFVWYMSSEQPDPKGVNFDFWYQIYLWAHNFHGVLLLFSPVILISTFTYLVFCAGKRGKKIVLINLGIIVAFILIFIFLYSLTTFSGGFALLVLVGFCLMMYTFMETIHSLGERQYITAVTLFFLTVFQPILLSTFSLILFALSATAGL